MKKFILLFICIFAFSFESIYAGGFQVNLQGQKQTGMGHTGTGLVLDAATILFNPGGLCFLDTTNSVIGGTSFIFPSTVFQAAAPSTYSVSTVKNFDTPFTLYANYKFHKTDKWNVGLGIYTPFGSRVVWPDDWTGEFILRNIDLKTIFVQPTFSYQINDKLGIGAGVVYADGIFSLEQAIPVQFSNGDYGKADLSGSSQGWGYNAGIYYKVNDKLSAGLDYRSSVKISINNGKAKFTVPNAVSSYFPETTFSSDITMPAEVSLGLGYKVNNKLKLAVDVNRVGWHVYDTLSFAFKDTTAQLKDIHSPQKYKDAFIFRAGAQYMLNDKITVRVGAYYDISPVQNGYLTPEVPDATKLGLSCGATLKLGKKLKVDASFLFDNAKKRTDTNIEYQFTGTYKTIALIPGIGLEYDF